MDLENGSLETDFDDIFEEAMQNYSLAKTAWDQIHQDTISDIKFGLLGEQWDPETVRKRKLEKRTVKVFDRCSRNIRYVVNSAMKEPPSIKVNPISTNKKKEADIISGIVRQIETQSNAKDVYADVYQYAVAGGLAAFRVEVDPDDVKRPIKIKKVVDVTSLYPDPASIEPDFSDMSFLISTKRISKKKFKELYPDYQCTGNTTENRDWFTNDDLQLMEYWTKQNNVVNWYLMTANEVVDSSITQGGYPGSLIPFCFIIGNDIVVDGERKIKSLIRDFRADQEAINYNECEQLDYIANTSKTIYTGPTKAFKGYEDIWSNVGVKRFGYLPYEGDVAPHKLELPSTPISFMQTIQQMDENIKASAGIRDPLRDIPASSSGKAVKLQMTNQGVATYIWINHLQRAIKYAGDVIVDLIPKLYNYPHSQIIQDLSGQISSQNIMMPDQNGNMINLEGEYMVSLSTGSSYETQREETRDQLLEMSKTNPQIAQIGSDILVRNMDFRESEELSDRLFAMLPPQIQALKQNDNQDPKMMIMQMKQQLDQMSQILEQTTQTLTQKTQEANELQNMVQNKSQMEMMKLESQNQNKLQTEVMGNQSAEQQIVMKGEYDLKMKEMEMNYQLRMKEIELEIEKAKSMSQITQNIVPEIIQTY